MHHELPQVWQDLMHAQGIDQLTPIQQALFEPIQAGGNLLAISPTGSGKTLAFLLPLLLGVKKGPAQQVLILAPNSELAGQLYDVTKTWAEPLGLKSQLFLSGSSQKRQIERLKKGPEILLGTPGRVLELMKLKKIKPANIKTVVLDEFDQLLSQSQFHFVDRILHYAPITHQVIYLSATQAVDGDKLEAETAIINLEDQSQPQLHHFYLEIEARDRVETLRSLAYVEDFKALVFFNALSDLGSADEKLTFRKVPSKSLASDVNIKDRKTILQDFKDDKLTLLLATDLLARGIDIEGLEWVVNFEVPRDKEAYVHRSGRTGRMGKEGAVITLISHPSQLKDLKKYCKPSPIYLKGGQLYID